MEEEGVEDMEETTKEKGNALEKDVEFLFQSAGFETQRNIRVVKYEVDLLAKIGDRNIIIECKNYQSSKFTIRNLIHEWNSKNQIIKANKIIIVITGLQYKESDKELANRFGIELWNEKDLTELFNLTLKPNELKSRLLSKISLKPITISELYRDEIASLIIRPLLKGVEEDTEETFKSLNRWLRAYIRTNLQLEGTTKEERIKHIELFEGTKEKRGFFNIFKVKRKEMEYWNKLGERLQEENILGQEIQKRYYKIMCELIEEYRNQKEYFKDKNNISQIMKLISDRIYDALRAGETICKFGFDSKHYVEVRCNPEGEFILSVDRINNKQASVLDWILTSEHFFIEEEIGNRINYLTSWFSYSFKETVEKIFRVLDEFFGFEDSDNLRDFSL